MSSERESVLEEAPSFQGFDHVTDHLHLSASPLGPDPSIVGNELIHTGDPHANTVDAWPCKDPHGLDSEASFLQPPISLEFGPEEGPNMFASLFGVLSSFSSSSSLSRSSSSSSSSSLSPDLQPQWGDDSPSPTRSPNRSPSEESASPDFSFDDDIVYPPRAFKLDDWYSENIDFLSMPGGFSTVDNFEPGTSAGTIRPLVNSLVSDGISTPSDDGWSSNYGDYATPELNEADIFGEHLEDVGETVDGGDQEYRSNGREEGFEGHHSSNRRGSDGGQDWRQVSAGGAHSNGHGSGGEDRRGGGSDDHRDDERDWGAPSTFSTPSDTESEDSGEEDAGPSGSAAPGSVSTSGDDDVPLARRIPTALRAQRTIRKQVRDEKDERRRQRHLRRQQRQEQQQQQQRHQTHSQTLIDEVSSHHMQAGPTLSRGSAKPTSARASRPRTKTLPDNSSRPIAAEDLSRRLRDIQEALNVPSLKSHSLSPSDSHSHTDQLGQRSRDHARVPNVGIQDKTLRPMRSFHRPRTADATREQPMPMPALALETHRLGRSATTASRPVKQRDQPEAPTRATSTRRPRTSDGAHQPSTALLHPSAFQRIAIPRTPTDIPSTPAIVQAVPKETKQISWQQRVFIVDLQRFNTLMMNLTTTAKEIIDTLEAQGQLANWAGVGGWMLFEVSQDFGMGECHSRLAKSLISRFSLTKWSIAERPIRHFESVSEVINSWDKDKSVNLLVAKKTPLATLLHPSVWVHFSDI